MLCTGRFSHAHWKFFDFRKERDVPDIFLLRTGCFVHIFEYIFTEIWKILKKKTHVTYILYYLESILAKYEDSISFGGYNKIEFSFLMEN